jgi:glycosyltransferase involved in cell wall biosynthesis
MTEKSSTVSIITRTRDRPILLCRAVESVLNQSFDNWRHIIVNDGGDAVAIEKFLAPYADRYAGRLTIVHNEKTLGMQGASNAGLGKADGTFVAIHDDDDEWDPEFLTATVAFLDEKGQGSVYQGVITHTVKVLEDIDAEGRILEMAREPYLNSQEVNLFKVGYENPFPPIAFLYRRKVHDVIGKFDPHFDFAGDMDFNVHFLLHWEIGVIPRPLAFYHWRRKSANGNLENSVTVRADEHAVKFNEFLNHYLRLETGGDEKNLGLALNLGRHAVTASVNSRAALERIDDQNGRLTDFKAHLESLSAALSGDALPRIADLKTHLESVSGVLGGVALSQAEAVEKARDLKEHLASIGGILSTDAVPKLADLKAHVASLGGIIEEVYRAQSITADAAGDLKSHLVSVSGILEAILREESDAAQREADIKAHLESIGGTLTEDAVPRLGDMKAHLKSLSGANDEVLRLAGESAQCESDIKAHLESIGGRVEVLAQSQNLSIETEHDLKSHLDSVSGVLVEVLRNLSESAQREADLKAHLNSISGQLEKLEWQHNMTEERDAALAGEVRVLRADLAAWREEERARDKARSKGWRVGRLWMRWRKRGEL